jgi:hypothetical protein
VPRIMIRTIRSKTRQAAWSYIMPQAEKTFDNEITPKLKSYFERIVARWAHAPKIMAVKIKKPGVIGTSVRPWGQYADSWRWITLGTPERTIVPKKPGGVLVFRTDYKPKTRGGGQYRGPGVATGDLVFTKIVRKHKIKPRNFEKNIVRYMEQWRWRQRLENAIKRGVYAYNRAMARTVTK